MKFEPVLNKRYKLTVYSDSSRISIDHYYITFTRAGRNRCDYHYIKCDQEFLKGKSTISYDLINEYITKKMWVFDGMGQLPEDLFII